MFLMGEYNESRQEADRVQKPLPKTLMTESGNLRKHSLDPANLEHPNTSLLFFQTVVRHNMPLASFKFPWSKSAFLQSNKLCFY